MAIKSGQIVIFRFPQTDLIIGKMRPALLLANLPANQNDWLVCMISSQLRQAVANVDEIIEITGRELLANRFENDERDSPDKISGC